ncbi:unnamed protein product [Clonostachys rhizophaga]|uniref:RidA family protein n=1 Tax=Clonostachys rhizophaga TaxID=160324 RepID=A0A9N9YL38_9HYPO|nr:unnamed protein product [Clonostachys rhizophaga]
MSSRIEIRTDRAPAPRPSNFQAIVHNGMIFCSGAIGVDPVSSKLVEGPTTARAAAPEDSEAIALAGKDIPAL